MSYDIIITPVFKRLFKKLAKKYPSLKNELDILIDKLSEEPSLGVHLGQNLHKIRVSISSKNKGKSGGARVISLILRKEEEVYLVYIYDKSELDNLSKDEISSILRELGLK
ncbi:type II toxin-antitoxin system RelE/ParE family toxin [Belliella sp. DSM 107340]|uniref:Type II toxin-antitoxin system RelE/ParE family toxin n=1 Tax=Belliella calami TaxID=2923436 RepID=A0ABS9URU5_9BACT|nr:type II toxin-antitoxin system RelE/ParE family toxin [Belliella calami]MCH7399332.1 type II toxin-antitoxin system RelE/ParE family toxin [Belliella calami]